MICHPRSVTSAAKASGAKPNAGLEEAFLLTASDIEADKSKIWNSVEVFDLYLSMVVRNVAADLLSPNSPITLGLIFWC